MKMKALLPALAAIFTFSIIGLGTKYLGLLFPALSVPFCLWPFILLSAIESAYFATYYLGPRTPSLWRLIELAVWLVPVYLLSGRSAEPFLRNGFWVVSSWLMARGYGSQLSFMERVADHLGDQGAQTVHWEYESLASLDSDHAPLKYFWRRFFGYGGVIAILAMAFHAKIGDLHGEDVLHLRLLGSAAVASGLALQGGAYLFRLQILWGYAKADVHPSLARTWLKGMAVLLLVLVLFINVAPVDYWPLTATRISTMLRNFVVKGPTVSMPPITSDEKASRLEEDPFWFFPEDVALGPWGFILAFATLIVFAGMTFLLVSVIGLVALRLVGHELEKLRGLPKLAAQVYLGLRESLRILLGMMRNIRVGPRPLGRLPNVSELGEVTKSKKHTESMRKPRGVRAMFRRIAKVAKKKGLAFFPSQTALEYGKTLQEHFPEVARAVQEFLDGYQKVRYSDRELSESDQGKLLEVGAVIVEEIERWKGE